MIPSSRLRWTGPEPVVIAFGSNMGPRLEILEQACRALERHGIRIARTSRVFETRPLAGSTGGFYLNACVSVRTRLAPEALLARCRDIERRFGRVRHERWGPRPLDLDLILYGTVQTNSAELTLPHPRLKDRDFVLVGLLDLGVGFPLPGNRTSTRRLHEWLACAGKTIVSVRRERIYMGTTDYRIGL
jgi:2-amino-4-hydroxy-6-hydroxymethyldihydropteridine diphosphokinase